MSRPGRPGHFQPGPGPGVLLRPGPGPGSGPKKIGPFLVRVYASHDTKNTRNRHES